MKGGDGRGLCVFSLQTCACIGQSWHAVRGLLKKGAGRTERESVQWVLEGRRVLYWGYKDVKGRWMEGKGTYSVCVRRDLIFDFTFRYRVGSGGRSGEQISYSLCRIDWERSRAEKSKLVDEKVFGLLAGGTILLKAVTLKAPYFITIM